MFLQLPLLYAHDLGFSSLHERRARSGDVLRRSKEWEKASLLKAVQETGEPISHRLGVGWRAHENVPWGDPNTWVWGKSGKSQDGFWEEKETMAECGHGSHRSEKLQHEDLERTGAWFTRSRCGGDGILRHFRKLAPMTVWGGPQFVELYFQPLHVIY